MKSVGERATGKKLLINIRLSGKDTVKKTIITVFKLVQLFVKYWSNKNTLFHSILS